MRCSVRRARRHRLEQQRCSVGHRPDRWNRELPLPAASVCGRASRPRSTGSVVAGVVHGPALRETFTARRGGGAFLNGLPLRVSSVPRRPGPGPGGHRVRVRLRRGGRIRRTSRRRCCRTSVTSDGSARRRSTCATSAPDDTTPTTSADSIPWDLAAGDWWLKRPAPSSVVSPGARRRRPGDRRAARTLRAAARPAGAVGPRPRLTPRPSPFPQRSWSFATSARRGGDGNCSMIVAVCGGM